ncbi:peptidase M50 [Ignisphaera aggregans DSM 17230]|uniref:Peptidase M50 n=1 Tax=Ignisphaera aggregans (strain DSM 17230 / JCM 13409 / AQ1.S1) TaxID=583356 RepID=E0SS19_IGNAA|nr:peptidase M50 [Ignisphaera aggregans DSM 17230]
MIDIVMLIVIYIVLTSIIYIVTRGKDIAIYGKRIRFIPGGFLAFIGKEKTPIVHRPVGKKVSLILIITMVLGMAIFYIFFLPIILRETIFSYIFYATGKTSTPPQPSVVPIPMIFMFRDILIYIIVAIGIGVIVHEVAHAIIALREGIKLRSWGIGIVFLMPLAFVELDEEQFNRAPARSRLNIVSAGSFANALIALIAFILLISLRYYIVQIFGNPVIVPMVTSIDCSLCNTNPICPARVFGAPTIIYSINGTRLYSSLQIGQILLHTQLNSTIPITICSAGGECKNISIVLDAYNEEIFNRNGTKVPCLGVRLQDVIAFERNGHIYVNQMIIELTNYLAYIFMINLSLYAFNAIPLIISDGSLFISILSELFRWLKPLSRSRVIDIINIFIIAIATGISTYLLLRP